MAAPPFQQRTWSTMSLDRHQFARMNRREPTPTPEFDELFENLRINDPPDTIETFDTIEPAVPASPTDADTSSDDAPVVSSEDYGPPTLATADPERDPGDIPPSNADRGEEPATLSQEEHETAPLATESRNGSPNATNTTSNETPTFSQENHEPTVAATINPNRSPDDTGPDFAAFVHEGRLMPPDFADFITSGGLNEEVADVAPDFVCGICRLGADELEGDVVRLHGMHDFCRACIVEWFGDEGEHNTCPMCRFRLFEQTSGERAERLREEEEDDDDDDDDEDYDVYEDDSEPLWAWPPGQNDEPVADGWDLSESEDVGFLARIDRIVRVVMRGQDDWPLLLHLLPADSVTVVWQARVLELVQTYVMAGSGLWIYNTRDMAALPKNWFATRYQLYADNLLAVDGANYRIHYWGNAVSCTLPAQMNIRLRVSWGFMTSELYHFWIDQLSLGARRAANSNEGSFGVACHPIAWAMFQTLTSVAERFDNHEMTGTELYEAIRYAFFPSNYLRQGEDVEPFRWLYEDMVTYVVRWHHRKAIEQLQGSHPR
ncbi:hypothetical protein MBLNU230_g6371t1 [Neophaeotheca triangularis]